MKKTVLFLSVLAMALAFASCSGGSDEPDFTLSDHTLYAGDSIMVVPNVKTANNFVAQVSNDGWLYGLHVGETTMSYDGQTATVSVRGHYNAFNVLTDWTLTPAQVIEKQGTPYRQTDSDGIHYVVYRNEGVANLLGYMFKNNTLYMVMAMSNPRDMEEITNYLTERYVFFPEEVGAYEYAGVDSYDPSTATTWVVISLDADARTDYMLTTAFAQYRHVTSSDTRAAKTLADMMAEAAAEISR